MKRTLVIVGLVAALCIAVTYVLLHIIPRNNTILAAIFIIALGTSLVFIVTALGSPQTKSRARQKKHKGNHPDES
jgi:ABC-type transport system involved in cytochrome c biogenesis permease component